MGQIHNLTQEALAETTEAEKNVTRAEGVIENARELLQVFCSISVF